MSVTGGGPKRSPRRRVQVVAVRALTALHRSLYRVSGGKIGGAVGGSPVLLLTVPGRTTGKRRTTPLVYLERDGDLLIAASNAGRWPPAWHRNVRAHPEVEVLMGRRQCTALARDAASGAERDELWAWMVDQMPRLEGYAARLDGEVPVVIVSFP